MEEKIKKKNIKRVVSLIIALVIIFFLFGVLYKNINELKNYQWKINAPIFILSLIFMYIGIIFLSIMWGLIIRKTNVEISTKKSIRIWFLSQIARYVPGRVLLLFGRIYLAKKEGISQYKTILSIILELALTVISGILIFFISLPFWFFLIQQKINYIFLLIVMVIVVLFGLIFLYPPLFSKIINFFLKIIKQEKISLEITYVNILKFLFFYFIDWIVLGFGFYLLINSIYPLKISLLPTLIGIFTIAWIIAFLSFLTPAGIGVREGILSYLLSFYMPLSIAIIISLLSRICLTFIEISVALILLKL